MDMTQLAGSNAGTIRSGIDEARQGGNRMAGKVADAATGAPDALTRIKDQVVRAGQVEIDQVRAAGQRLAQRGGEYVHQMERVVRTRPLTSVAVVAGVSALAVYAAMRLLRHPQSH